MKLANIILKTEQIGNSVPLKNVTPAEVMLLVAANHAQAGGDPIIKLELAKKKAFKEKGVHETDGAGVKQYEADPSKENGKGEPIMVDGWVETDEEIEVKRTPSAERLRLLGKYGAKKVNKVLGSGPIPSIPETFEEAIAAGLQMSLVDDRFFLVGAPE